MECMRNRAEGAVVFFTDMERETRRKRRRRTAFAKRRVCITKSHCKLREANKVVRRCEWVDDRAPSQRGWYRKLASFVKGVG